ncbi:MAG: hydrogenase formation protein HypD [Thermoleophilia bacterium]
MRYVDEYRDPEKAGRLLAEIAARSPDRPVTLMEVCGSHTMAISRFGVRRLLPENVRLVSGPGCPVCVSPVEYLDRALALARLPDLTLATFGDLIRVPGSRTTLAEERAAGADVRVVYSPLDAVGLAEREPDREIVFLGIGFETTAPTVAGALLAAEQKQLPNFFVLCDHKVMPPPMKALLQAPDVRVDGFLCPGHVSAVIGSDAYRPLAEEYGVACVVAGFEPQDILLGILLLLRQLEEGRPRVENAYLRAVRPEGNQAALALLDRVFEPVTATWRGLGDIPESGLALREAFWSRDASRRFTLEVPPGQDHPGCRCAQVLRGVIRPTDCPLFARTCVPDDPKGACMVSSEGTCAAYYRYERLDAAQRSRPAHEERP